jgi:hypothetical protein
VVKYYAGIGSRQAPGYALLQCTQVSKALEQAGFILRSGGADGADKAFEAGIVDSTKKEILRPADSTPEAEAIAQVIHPVWGANSDYAKKLHGRNVQIVLGKNLDSPVEFVVAWTFDGVKRGGSRTALVCAKNRGIPTFNLANKEELLEFGKFLVKYGTSLP